jgi:aminoglycoside phosphotransferase (APT) family kinase protein
VADDNVFAKGRDLATSADAMRTWLGTRLPGDVVEVRNLRYPVGAGVSNETILFEAVVDEGGSTTERPLVLRVSPAPDYQLFLDVGFDRQFRLLQTLHEHDLVKVPRVLWYDDDPQWFGRPFFVMEQMKGRVPVSMPVYNSSGWLVEATPDQRRTMWDSALREMARIHVVPLELVEFVADRPAGVSGFDLQLRYGWDSFDWTTPGIDAPNTRRIRDWLYDNIPDPTGDGLQWGDARMGNMMFGDDYRVVGVMDWEQAALGGALFDLGWWLFFDDVHSVGAGVERLAGLGTRAETIDIWEDATGLSAEGVEWYEVFTGFRVATLSIRTSVLRAGPEAAAGADGMSNFIALAYERIGWDPPSG